MSSDARQLPGEGGLRVDEVRLPGIGLRHDFQTHGGRRIGVVSHRTGQRDLLVYDRHDPDRCSESIPLRSEEADALAEILGAPRIVERLAALHEQVAGLASEEIGVAAGSPYDNRTLGDTQARTRTGASIVAVLRDEQVLPSPGPDFRFQGGDRVVVVGTREGIEAVGRIFTAG